MTTFYSHTVYNNNNVIIDRLLFVTQIIIISIRKYERDNPNNKVFTVEIFENQIYFITAPTRFYDICNIMRDVYITLYYYRHGQVNSQVHFLLDLIKFRGASGNIIAEE